MYTPKYTHMRILAGYLASEFGKPASVLYDSCEGQKTTSSGRKKYKYNSYAASKVNR